MARRCWLPALAATALALSWQLLTVHFNYGGNLTALFCTGDQRPVPAALAGEHLYIFHSSPGYDGQAYHYMAHDPFDSNGIGRYVDAPTTRYRRILLPGLAYLVALGRQDWIDRSYIACTLGFLFLGAWWLARLLERRGMDPWFGMFYLLVPATLIALDRLTVDMALTSLVVGFAFYSATENRRMVWVMMALAALCRDTGVILTVAWIIPLLARKQFREALRWGIALAPALVWNLFVTLHMPPGIGVDLAKILPFAGWIELWLHPPVYHLSPALTAFILVLDWMQLLGFLLAFLLGLRRWREAPSNSLAGVCVLWAAMGILLPPFWQDDIYVSRLFSPLLILEFLEGQRLPMAMIVPRVGAQIGPQILGVLRGFFS
jgi:hypothetical protein